MKELFLQYGYLSALWLLYLVVVIIIGWACWQWVYVSWIGKRQKATKTAVDSVWFRLLLFTAVGYTTIGALSLPFYLLHGSSLLYAALVGLLFIGSLVQLLIHVYARKSLIESKLSVFFGKGFKYQFNSKTLVFSISILLLLVLVVGDGLFSLVRLSHISDGSDANVHLSRIVDITENGFSIRDGFFAEADETRYAFNFEYALFVPIAIAGKVFGALPFETAVESPIFFRLIQLFAIGALSFGLARVLFKTSRRGAFYISILAVYVGFLVNNFATAYYPNVLVFAWFAMLLLALIVQAIQPSNRAHTTTLLLLTSLCIAGTHPTYGIIAAFLVVLIRVALFIIDIVQKRNPFTFNFWTAVVSCFVLMLPGLFVFLQPNHMTDQAIMIESGSASLHVLGTKVFPPELGMTADVRWNILQIIGTLAIIFLAFKRSIKIGVISAVTLGITLLTISDPIFVRLMNALHIPYWVMSRFASVNVILGYGITICFGVYVIYRALLMMKSSSKELWAKTSMVVLGMVFAVVLLSMLASRGYVTYKTSYQYAKYNGVAMSVFERIRHDVSPHLNERELVLATNYTSYYLPIVKPATVIYTDSLHMPPSVDGGDRKQCQIDLFNSLDSPNSLRSAGIKYVVIDAYEPNGQYEKMLKTLKSLPDDYKELANDDIYAVFAVTGNKSSLAPKSCIRYQQVE